MPRAKAKPIPLTADQQKVVTDNLGLVYRMLFMRGYQKTDQWFEEVESLCVEALMRAARGFNPARGFKFSTYACRAILGEIYRWRQTNMKHDAHHQRHREQAQVELAARYRAKPENGVECEEEAAVLRAKIEVHLAGCTPQERDILRMLIWDGLTLTEVGARFSLCKERVRQIESGALARIREHWDSPSA